MNQVEAVSLNNHCVHLLKEGALQEAYETCCYAMACLDEEQSRPARCSCRLLHLADLVTTTSSASASAIAIAGAGTFTVSSTTNDLSMGNPLTPLPYPRLPHGNSLLRTTAQQVCEGNESRSIPGYEWVDCKPQAAADETASSDAPAGSSEAQRPRKKAKRSSTSTSVPTSLFHASHETQLAFLSLGAIKIQMKTKHIMMEDGTPYSPRCDCAVRWVLFHNLAVVTHLVALTLGEHGHGLLQQAHHCYSWSQKTIPALVPFAEIVRLFLNGQNNQLSIFQEFAMHSESNACLTLLADLLTALPLGCVHTSAISGTAASATSATTTSTGSQSEEEGSLASASLPPNNNIIVDHGILLNLMVMSRIDTAPAA